MKAKVVITVLVLVVLVGLTGGCRQKSKTSKNGGKLPSKKGPGKTYVVSKDGVDKNPGTEEEPWRTIQRAVEKVKAGDKVYVRDGEYNESLQIKKSGSADAYITFAAYPKEKPIIDGAGVEDWNNGIVIDCSTYIELSGFEIRDWRDNGMEIYNSNHLRFSDCKLHDVGGGVQLLDGTHDFEFKRVEAYRYDLFGFDASPGDDGAPCYNGTFKDCSAHTGRDPEQNVDGFALGHGKQRNFKLNRCEVYDVYDGFDMSAEDTEVNNCSAHDCWNAGFKIWNDNITVTNCLIYNNAVSNVARNFNGPTGTATLFNCTLFAADTFNISIETSKNSLHMYNCILAGGKNIGLAFEKRSAKNYKGDYNLFQNDNTDRAIAVGCEGEFSLSQLSGWQSYSGQDKHSITATSPSKIFVDPKKFDLHLLEGSPAIDKGRSESAPPKDYDGKSRPRGKGYDIGAYER